MQQQIDFSEIRFVTVPSAILGPGMRLNIPAELTEDTIP